MREQTQPLPGRQQHHRFWWLMPTPFSWFSSLLYTGVLLFVLAPSAPGAAGTALWQVPVLWQVSMIASIVLGLLLVDRLEYRRYGEQVPARVAALLIIARVMLIGLAAVIEGFNFIPMLYLLLPYFVMVSFGYKMGYAMAALVTLIYFAQIWWFQHDWYLNRYSVLLAFLFVGGMVFVVVMARAILLEKASRLREQASRIQAEELLTEVKHAHRQLQAYAEQVAALATLEERNRVAREIHDSLGHALMAINVQLEKALVYHDSHPQEAVQAIRDAKSVAKEALQDVRRSVRALRTRQEAFSCTRAIELLVERLRSSSLVVDFVVTGSEETFPRQALMTLYRVAQEGFTNIQKHAQATTVQASLHFEEEEARLNILDNGRGFDAPSRLTQLEGLEEGYGLRGIQERLELAGGSFRLESQPGAGTHLSVIVARAGMAAHVQQDVPQRIESAL